MSKRQKKEVIDNLRSYVDKIRNLEDEGVDLFNYKYSGTNNENIIDLAYFIERQIDVTLGALHKYDDRYHGKDMYTRRLLENKVTDRLYFRIKNNFSFPEESYEKVLNMFLKYIKVSVDSIVRNHFWVERNEKFYLDDDGNKIYQQKRTLEHYLNNDYDPRNWMNDISTPEEIYITNENIELIMDCIAALPEKQKTVLVECGVKDKPQNKVAKMMGNSPAAVTKLFQKARWNLIELLREKNYTHEYIEGFIREEMQLKLSA